MIDYQSIEKSIYDIIHTVTNGKLNISDKKETKDALYFIVSNSIKATQFVATLEDEFEIEFDDDEINMAFFSDINIIIDLIIHHIKK